MPIRLGVSRSSDDTLLKSVSSFIDAFAHSSKKATALQKLKDDEVSIPTSCNVDFDLKVPLRVKESLEFKALDAATALVVSKCEQLLKGQVIKAQELVLQDAKHGVVESLAWPRASSLNTTSMRGRTADTKPSQI